MGVLLKVMSMSLLVAASLASLPAVSLPGIPACDLTLETVIFHFDSCRVATRLLISTMRYAWLRGFCRESSVILLSLYTIAVRGLFSGTFRVATASRAFIKAVCSAWLFEHLLSNLDLICVAILFPMNIIVPDPTPSSPFLPSVYARTVEFFVSSSSMIMAPSARCGQFLFPTT